MDPEKDPSGNGQSEASDASSGPRGTTGAFPTFQIPDHELLRCIGRGSYGEVWLARNMMGEYRAIKLVYRKSFQHQKPFERELSGIRKFEPISRSHEGFVDVLHVGQSEQGGCFYYVMELGDDQDAGQAVEPKTYAPRTLAKEISRRGKLAVSDCSRIGLALSQALAELHKHGLVHRDIKPSNIIFVNGVPKLADIGLVAGVDEARSYVGTEGFIPPEGPGTPQADIYSLGKVLYEASTGRDRQDFPELPTHWDESSEHEAMLELNEIILRACKQELERRYATATDMEADLVVLANGKSVRRLKLLERRVINLKRLASIAALLLAVAVGILFQTYRQIAKARAAQIEANILSGDRMVETGDLLGALPYFSEVLRLDGGNREQALSHRLRFESAMAQCPKLTQLLMESARINDGQFSADGKRVLIAQYTGQAQMYDLPDGTPHGHPFGKGWGLVSASISPDGKLAVTGSEDGSVLIWDTSSLEPVAVLPHPAGVNCVRFSPDGLRVVSAGKDGNARVWVVRTGALERELRGHTDEVFSAQFSADGQYIVTGGYDRTARVWRAADGRPVMQTKPHPRGVRHAALSPDNLRIVTACEDHKARVWEVATGRRFGPDLAHGTVVRSAEFSPDGRLLLTASLDSTVRFWRAVDLQPLPLNPVIRNTAAVSHAAFSPDGQFVLACCFDGSVRIWDLGGGIVVPAQRLGSFSGDGRRWLKVTDGAFQVWDAGTEQPLSPEVSVSGVLEKAQFGFEGRFVMTLSAQAVAGVTNHLLQVYESESGRSLGIGLSLPGSPWAAVLSRDGRCVVTLAGNLAELWDVRTWKLIGQPLVHSDQVKGAAFSPDGSRVATRAGNQLCVWNATTGQLAFAPANRQKPIEYIDFSPDGHYLITCCSDRTLDACSAQIWNAATGKEVGPELKHDDGVLFAVFSPDSRRVVTCGEDRVAILWDVLTGRQWVQSFTHDDQVKSAAFSSDGKWLATVSPDHTARVWNTHTGHPLTPPLRHDGLPGKVMFSPDSRKLITSDIYGRTNWIWELPVKNRPVDDLLLSARVLAGTASGQPPESLASSWRGLLAKYPLDFSSSQREETIWHETQEAESEAEGQSSAALFHLERLLALRPSDPELARRLEAARRQVSKPD